VKTKRGGGERNGKRGRPARAWLPWLLGATIAVKIVVLIQLGNHPLLQPHGELDTAYYVELAQKVVRGGPLAVTEPFFVSPLYVYFLAVIFRLSGDSLAAARIVQILLGTAAVAFLYFTARQWFGERAARIAAVLGLLTGFFSFCEILILQASRISTSGLPMRISAGSAKPACRAGKRSVSIRTTSARIHS
jgi:4-amino-4-deoxy-L-arabinose transferase-like glycosyltransferase